MAEEKKLKIAVLMGGNSSERDVSLASGAGVMEGLKAAGHLAMRVDTALGIGQFGAGKSTGVSSIVEKPPSHDALQALSAVKAIETINSPELRKVDAVFIILHGGMGEDGTIQALLDLVEIPYTGSGVLASALAMNKYLSKLIFQSTGIPTPDFLIRYNNKLEGNSELISAIQTALGFPVVVKPNDQGSSVGLDIIKSPEELYPKSLTAFNYSDSILFEKYISGRELTVAILGDETLPPVEIKPKDGFYDYHHKYTAGMTEYLAPAPLSQPEELLLRDLGLKAFSALGCSGFGRVDFRMAANGSFYCLEVNTLPGMTNTSLVPKAAKAAGIEFPQLLDRIIRIAIDEHRSRKQN